MFRLQTHVGACIFVVVLAGCGQSQQAVNPPATWISPQAKSGDLLYVSDYAAGAVYIFSYPEGDRVGAITGIPTPAGICSDSRGHVFVTTFDSQEVLEYAHGGTSPVRTLNNPGYYMWSCAVDSSTGDLAVTDFETLDDEPGGVAIFPKARGVPALYKDAAMVNPYVVAYDEEGNLFVDGVDESSNFVFAELPRQSVGFTGISLRANIGYPGGVQWDGSYIAVGDAKAGVIYQTSGARGGIVGRIRLRKSNFADQFVIDGANVVGANTGSASTMFWQYPGGGRPTATLSGFDHPIGVTVSRVSTSL